MELENIRKSSADFFMNPKFKFLNFLLLFLLLFLSSPDYGKDLTPNSPVLDDSSEKSPLRRSSSRTGLTVGLLENDSDSGSYRDAGRGSSQETSRNKKSQGLGTSNLELVIQNGHSGAINGIVLTKDEKKMISWSADGTIKIWDVEQGKLLKTLEGHRGSVENIQITQNDKYIISSSFDKTLKIWELESGELLKTLIGHASYLQGFQLTSDNKKIISYAEDKTIKIWDIETGKLLNSIEGCNIFLNGFQLTKDEKKIISYSQDNTIKIWELETGKLLKSLEGHTDSVWKIKVIENESKLISYSRDKTIKIWDMETFKLLKTLDGHTKGIIGIQITKDEKKIISYSEDKTIKIWEVETGNLLKSLEGHTNIVSGIIHIKGEKQIVSYSDDGTIKIWNIEQGKLLKNLEGHTRWIRNIQLIKDEQYIISSSDDSTLKIWNIETGRLLKSLEGHTKGLNGFLVTTDEKNIISYSKDNTIKFWEVESGKLAKSFGNHTDSIEGYQLTKDKRKIIFNSKDNSINIWNLKSGKLINSLKGHTSSINGFVRTKNDRMIVSYSDDSTIKIWDSKNGKLLKSLTGHTERIRGVKLTKDEKRIISYSNDQTIKIWNFESGKLLKTLNSYSGHDTGIIQGIQLTKDEKKIISYSFSRDQPIKIWEMKTGKLLHSLGSRYIFQIKLIQDSKKLISLSNSNITIWDVETGKLLNSMERFSEEIDWAGGFYLTKNESKLISVFKKGKIEIWDILEGQLLNSIEVPKSDIDGILLTKNEDKLISYSVDKTIKIWDIETGKLLATLSGHTASIFNIQLFNDDKTLISTSSDNTIKIWDIFDITDDVKTQNFASQQLGQSSLQPRQTLDHKSSPIINYIIKDTPAGQILISFSSDGSIRYWDISDDVRMHSRASLRLTQLLFKNGESIYYTPEGYFDYTDKSVLDYISYVSPLMQNNFLDLQDLMGDYYEDDLLERILNGTFKTRKKRNSLTRSINTVPMIKPLFDPQKIYNSDKESETLRFEIQEKGSELDQVVIYTNGIETFSKYLDEESEEIKLLYDEPGRKKYKLKVDLPLNFGTNRIEVKAYNQARIPQSYPAFELIRKAPETAELQKPDLYILSVGVNAYKSNQLKYSVKDAEGIAEILSKNGKDLYGNVHKTLLLDKDATKSGIEKSLEEISKKARTQDVVLVYMSGHGMNAFTREGKRLFYYVPYDFTWPSDPELESVARGQGIDAEYLNEMFSISKIKSHKLILILDACHSGSVNLAMASKGGDKEKATRKVMEKMANGTGRFIFASSSGNEVSREHKDADHGLYTYVLLNALGGNKEIPHADAASNKDGLISMSEIRFYLEQNFEEQTKKYLNGVVQTPPSMSLGRNGMHERVNDFPLLKVK